MKCVCVCVYAARTLDVSPLFMIVLPSLSSSPFFPRAAIGAAPQVAVATRISRIAGATRMSRAAIGAAPQVAVATRISL
jgi:hypothetical protein